jgi:hypothetical protein
MTAALLGCVLAAPSSFAGSVCGREEICSDNEICCEHVVASFGADGPMAGPYVAGRCAPKSEGCKEFWCGNRHCEAGLFGRPTVCCVNTPPGGVPEYSCAHSELSCPGNNEQLSIRDRQPEFNLRGS